LVINELYFNFNKYKDLTDRFQILIYFLLLQFRRLLFVTTLFLKKYFTLLYAFAWADFWSAALWLVLTNLASAEKPAATSLCDWVS